MGQISCGDPQWITWWILLAIHTDCGLPLRMSRIQLYWDEQRASSLSLMVSLERTVVLNTEQWSVNNNMTNVFQS